MYKLFPLCLSVIILLISSCQTPPPPQDDTHPIENKLIPNVQIVTNPQSVSIEQQMKSYDIPGFAIGMIENKSLGWTGNYGMARKDEQIPMTEASIFAVGSISKPVVSLLVLKLVEQGKLSLDQDVNEYLKSWQLPESKFTQDSKITLRHLLNHKAGINPFNSKGITSKAAVPALTEILNGGKYSPGVSIDTLPGLVYKYSNLGFGIVQLVLEDVTNQSLEELAQTHIFKPLQMHNSSFLPVQPTETNKEFVYAYYDDGNAYNDYWKHSLIPASGGLKSTVNDLAKLLLALADALEQKTNSLISFDIAKQIIAQQGYHLGFEIDGEEETLSITHTGRVPGFFAYMRYYPNTGKGLIMLCNSDNGGDIFKDVLRGASDLYGWDIISPKLINVVDKSVEELKTFIGDYRLVLGEDEYILSILADEDQLKYMMKDEEDEYPLRPVGDLKFVDLIDGDDFEFVIENNVASKVITNNEYTFNRVK